MSPTHRNKPKSRFAPTPSGLLHKGNGFNFLLTYLITKSRNGSIHLRVDDYDLSRSRIEFVQDIFDTLDYLGLDWDSGPVSCHDFQSNYTSKNRHFLYHDYLQKLTQTFVCECSRKDLENYYNCYPGFCYDKLLQFKAKENCIKIKGKDNINDFVVWTRENCPSYQLASLVDDKELGINLIIRGYDLEESTELQKFLASNLSYKEFESVEFIFHQLLKDKNGVKLSKSNHSQSMKFLRDNGMSKLEFYKEFCEFMKIDLNGKLTLENLVEKVYALSW
ncbi:MAG: hypothetical protein HN576_09295 [Bacteriovoracaceae bacterium]|jgi:glutamyl/glutaminyl-tRNA synthetase|nr:hypothetical protein [Bacteriovoracaceae bacterium]